MKKGHAAGASGAFSFPGGARRTWELAKDPRPKALDATSCGSFDFARRLASLRMTLHSRDRGRPGPKAAGVAKREDSYGPKSGPKAGSRASSPGEQAAACDYIKTRALGRGASRSLRLPKNS